MLGILEVTAAEHLEDLQGGEAYLDSRELTEYSSTA